MNDSEILRTYFLLKENELIIAVIKINNSETVFSKKLIFEKTNTDYLSKEVEIFFLKNIEEIEKITKSFVKDIFLVIDDENIFSVNLSLKKKIKNKIITDGELKSLLTNGLQQIYKSYPDFSIIHFVINQFNIDGQTYYSVKDKLVNDFFWVELKFICIENNSVNKFKELFKKKEIHLKKIFSEKYVKQFNSENKDIIKTAIEIENGLNQLEVKLVPKKLEKKGFFENFFLSF